MLKPVPQFPPFDRISACVACLHAIDSINAEIIIIVILIINAEIIVFSNDSPGRSTELTKSHKPAPSSIDIHRVITPPNGLI